MLHFIQSFGDAYRLVDIAGIEADNLPFIVKNETGMHVSVKPDDSFEVILKHLHFANILHFRFYALYKFSCLLTIKLQLTVLSR